MGTNYHNLKVWQKAIDLVSTIYELTKTFPKEEMYGLTSQMRRSAVSMPSNIAEGSQRNTDKAFGQFLSTAQGSAAELETQLIIAEKQNMIENVGMLKRAKGQLEEVRKMTAGLYSQLNLKS